MASHEKQKTNKERNNKLVVNLTKMEVISTNIFQTILV